MVSSHYINKELIADQLNSDNIISSVEPTAQFQPDTCKCHQGSVFRCTKEVVVTVGTQMTIETTLVDCGMPVACDAPRDEDDNFESGGCGWFWLQSCNGTC